MTDKIPKRAQRKDLGNRRITDRNTACLEFIARAQPVSTSAIIGFMGDGAAVTRRGLRKLKDGGLARVHARPEAMAEANRYTLTAAGARHLSVHHERPREDYWVPRGVGRPEELAHHDMSVEFFVALSHGARRSGWLAVQEFAFERDIRRSLGALQRNALVPDSVAVVRTRRGERFAICLECDTGSETPSLVVSTKGRGYAESFTSGSEVRGCRVWAPLFVCRDVRRVNRLAAALWEGGAPAGLWYFAVASELAAESIATPIWRTVKVDAGGQTARLECVDVLAELSRRAAAVLPGPPTASAR